MNKYIVVGCLSLLLVAVMAVLFWGVRGEAGGEAKPTLREGAKPTRDSLEHKSIAAERRSIEPGIPSSAHSEVVIRVVDSAGRQVEQAEVFALGKSTEGFDSFESLGVTDKLGLFVLTNGEPPENLIVLALGFICKQAAVEDRDYVIVQLEESASIVGIVYIGDTTVLAPAGTTVLAWPTSIGLQPEGLGNNMLLGDPRCLVGTTDKNGRFWIDGFSSEGNSYNFVAGAKGYCTDSFVSIDVRDNADVVLHMNRLFGAELVLTDSSGDEFQADTNLNKFGKFNIDFSDIAGFGVSVERLFQPNYTLELTGIKDSIPYSTCERNQLLLSSSGDESRLGPVTVNVSIPGYVPKSQSIWISPVSGSLSIVQIDLERSDTKLGNLRVVYEGYSSHLSDSTNRTGPGTIVLHNQDSHEAMEIDVEGLSSGSQVVTGIPEGLWSAALKMRNSLFVYPDALAPEVLLSIVDQSEANFYVNLRSCGQIELTLQYGNGSLYRGPLQAAILEGEVHEGGTFKGGSVFFDNAPYILPPLASQTISVLLQHPEVADDESAVVLIPVASGRLSKRTISIIR